MKELNKNINKNYSIPGEDIENYIYINWLKMKNEKI